tara:strand:- start:21504 stop:22187 length:684 start_codon:yes stop_codon:yes gene_type:complete
MEDQKLKSLVIIGAGGHGLEVLWLARNMNKIQPTYKVIGFCDDNIDLKDSLIQGLPVLGTPESVAEAYDDSLFYHLGIGDNATRQKVAERVDSLGWQAETLIDPSAVVADDLIIGAGCYVGVCSNISPAATIGNHVIVHNQSSVGHDTDMADFSQVAPGGRVLGHVTIGNCGYLGSNSVVYPGKSVGSHAVLGACSFSISNIPDHSVAIGVPARLRSRPAPSKSILQ